MKTSNKLLLILFIVILIAASLTIAVIFNLHKASGKPIKGNGIEKTANRNVSGYTLLDIAGPFQVIVSLGEKDALRICGDSNILSYIKTKVENGTLYIFSGQSIVPQLPVRIEIETNNVYNLILWSTKAVSIKNIDNKNFNILLNGTGSVEASGKTGNLKIECNGNGNIDTESLKAENVDITLFGEGKIETLAMQNLEVTISGAGSFTATGKTKHLKITCSGAGSIDTRKLLAHDASIILNGAATADISASEKLNINISGLGKVIYYGRPKKVDQKITGLGKIIDGDRTLNAERRTKRITITNNN